MFLSLLVTTSPLLTSQLTGFTINAAGGGGGTGGVQTVANAAGLNALVDLTADPVVEPDDGQVVLVQNSTNLNADAASGDNDEDINGLPMTVAAGGPEGGYSNQIQVTVSWDADDDEWTFIRWVPTNMDNRYVLEAGDTMTGPLIMDDTTIQITEGTDTLTLNWPTASADRTISFPDAGGTVALAADDILLRLVNDATDSPLLLVITLTGGGDFDTDQVS